MKVECRQETDVQKFRKGDLVRVAKDLGPMMSHFVADCDAIVIGSYDDQYGRGDTRNYTLYLKGRGRSAWYQEDQLRLIERGRGDLLDEWMVERKAEADEKGDLDWIFSNGKDVLSKPHGASVAALARCFGLTNLWGSRGEGVTYDYNRRRTLFAATPFLISGDKEGWLKHCQDSLLLNTTRLSSHTRGHGAY